MALLCAVLLVLLPAQPAGAHSSDPRIVTTLEQVTPQLPAGVVVQVQASLAAQMVAGNTTSTPLEVLGLDGRPFLRLSAAGVEADVAHLDFLTTSTPNGATPPVADEPAPSRWVQISSGTSWGWYDHRLHPDEIVAPADASRPAQLGGWSIPFRYGETEVEARGDIAFEPLLGAFVVSADPAPASLTVQALPGRLPGLFLSNPEQLPLTVLGRDGEPFLRFGPQGVEVNVVSRTHVEDQQTRGQLAGPAAPVPRFELVEPGGTSYTWLDARLRYPQDLPPDDALTADGPTVVDQWEVPVEGLPGTPALTGQVRWEPEAGALAARRAAADSGGRVLLPVALGVASVLAVGGVVLAARRRRP